MLYGGKLQRLGSVWAGVALLVLAFVGCNGGKIADTPGHAPCTADDQCGGWWACSSDTGMCATSCAQSTACKPTAYCDTAAATCVALDPCDRGCDVNATCTAQVGGASLCVCHAGYTGNGTTCADVDECAGGANDCGPNTDCVNTEGGFSCPCSAGYVDAASGCVPDPSAYSVEQWRVVDIDLISSQAYADPFNDVDVTATFTGPAGEQIRRPAFWDGGSTWKIRFAPTAIGTWSMTTSATDPNNSGLNDVSASITCTPYTGHQDIYAHGFLRTSANGRYLTFADGTPFFYLGDTHWTLGHERFSTSNAEGVASEFKYIVDKRVSQGFTAYQSEPLWGEDTRPDEEPRPDFSDGFSSDDLPGLVRLDAKFAYIADKGLVHANAMITFATKPAHAPAYTASYMAKLAKYWVARYGAYPVIWTIAQEIDRNMYGAFDATTIGVWYAAAQSVADNDAYHQPIVPHMENTESTTAGSSWWKSKPYHSGWAVQWQGDVTGVGTAKDFWLATPHKPSILYESAYDHFWTDSRGALGAAYKAFQYGMYGYGYGAAGVWNDIYSKAGESHDYGTPYEMPDHYYWWYDGANLQTADQLTYFKKFYTSLAWWQLVPRFDDPTWASWSDATHSLLSSQGQDVFVVFFFGDGTATGTLNHMLAATYFAKWFNPRTGTYTVLNDFAPAAGQWSVPPKPDAADWVLVAQRGSSGLTGGTNLAHGASPTASDTDLANGYSPVRAVDGIEDGSWNGWASTGTALPQWLALDFGHDVTFDRVEIFTKIGYEIRDFKLQYWDAGTWHDLSSVTGNTQWHLTHTFPAVTSRQLRVWGTQGPAIQPSIVRINEIDVYAN